ncbi:MAG: phosphatidate cytidylyltransferase, partial [Candidatus Omnitrophica bacterium]|nr:phosphatidate cytidylyltransferase [Candidatus Omnitrophota bacterium]
AFGSTAASILAALIGCRLIPVELNLSLFHVAMLGAVFGGLGQLGDMSESMIKRDLGVKDSGKMLPALGGALDAIDSLLFSAPVFYFYVISLI